MAKQLRSTEDGLALYSETHDKWVEWLGLPASWAILPIKLTPNKLQKATTSWPDGYRTITIEVDPKYLREADPADIRQSAVHELMHVRTAVLWDAILEQVGGSNTKAGNAILGALESTIDELAALLLAFEPD